MSDTPEIVDVPGGRRMSWRDLDERVCGAAAAQGVVLPDQVGLDLGDHLLRDDVRVAIGRDREEGLGAVEQVARVLGTGAVARMGLDD